MDYSKLNIIGTLAKQGDPLLNGKDNVFINSQQTLQYVVQRISHAPQTDISIADSFFTGYLDSFDEDYAVEDSISEDDNTRIDKFRKEINSQVFVFRAREDKNYPMPKLQKGTFIQEKKSPDVDWNEQYVTIPVFQPQEMTLDWENTNRINLKRNYSSLNNLLGLLEAKQPIGTVEGFEEPFFSPFIIWYDGDKMTAIGNFAKCAELDNGYQFLYDSLGCVELNDEILSGIIYPNDFNPSILYLAESCYTKLYNRFASEDYDKTISKPKEEKTEQVPLKELVTISQEKTDKGLIEYCKVIANKMGLYYDEKDIANFHTAVKTKSLVILSGMSGTGKSRLVEVYAKALGIKPEQLLIIPVRPSWNDDSDLLGYVDLNNMVYRPSETGFLEILIEAEKNDDQLYMVCFDEMNLARVEHYFSQLLSILEKSDEKERKLRIYSKRLQGLYNSSEYPSEIKIGENIIFVGTVNIDESTYHFSDKVLDRSNVIELKVLDYSKEWKKTNYANAASLTWTKKEFSQLIQEPTDDQYIEYRACLWEIHQKLQEVTPTLGIGPRVVKRIEKYLCNYPVDLANGARIGECFDVQLVQRVFTKVRGSEEKLSHLFDVAGDANTSILDEIFNKYSTLSDFEKSKLALKQKKEELKIYGYCI